MWESSAKCLFIGIIMLVLGYNARRQVARTGSLPGEIFYAEGYF